MRNYNKYDYSQYNNISEFYNDRLFNQNNDYYKDANFLSRAVSFLIDICMVTLLIILFIFIVCFISVFKGFNPYNALPYVIFFTFIIYNTFIYIFLDNQSVGKKIMKIKVLNSNNQEDISFFKWLIRSFLVYLCIRFNIFLIINVISILILKNKQSLYDLVLKIKVVKIK